MYNSQNLPLGPLKIIKRVIDGKIGAIISSIFFCLALVVFVLFVQSSGSSLINYEILVILFIVIIVWICYIVYEYLYYRSYSYNFTNRTAEIGKGVVSRSTTIVNYEKINNIYVDQDFWDRLLGLYDVHFEAMDKSPEFNSHVDGLNKENSDKLSVFLRDKVTEMSVPTLVRGMK